jgi:signal transduction histidine kinase
MRLRITVVAIAAFSLLAVANFLLLETVLVPEVEDALVGQIRTEVTRELDLGADLLLGWADVSPDSAAGALATSLGWRVTIIQPDGVVVGDSDIREGELTSLENHAGRPEIATVLDDPSAVGFDTRRSATLGTRLMYGARGVDLNGAPAVLRIAVPTGAVAGTVSTFRSWTLAISLGVGLLGLVLAIVLSRRIVGPLSQLGSGVRRLADGQLDVRVPAGSGLSEVDRVSVAFNRLAGELRGQLEDLSRERDEMQILVDSIDEGILALSDDARVVRTNQAALELLGLMESPPYVPVGSLIRQPELRELLESAVVAAIGPTEVEVGDRTLVVSSHGVDRGGAVITLLDVTEVRRLEQVRSDFVANASHELKTPLTSMRGFAETLLDEEEPPEALRKEFLTSIRNNSIRLQRLVDDLLDLSRLESGGWKAREEEVEVAELAREVWSEGFKRRARKRDIKCRVQGRALVLADERALDQIFRNLFDNGLRHTADGGRLRVTIVGEAPMARISVTDTGSGIPSSHLPRIFERFFRADPARSRAEGGTGLGLAIVRHMVQAMGGEVWAESQLGVGTTIGFSLPWIREGDGPLGDGEPEILTGGSHDPRDRS